MPKLEVEITGAKKIENHNPIITLEAKKDFNIVRFMNIINQYKWNLVAERNNEIDSLCYSLENLNKMFGAGEFVKFTKPISRFIINYEKKCVFLQLKDKKINIKCDEKDKFDWKVGLGLAISHLNDNVKYKEHRNFFRNKKTHQLDIEKYAEWVLKDYYHNDMYDLENLELRVKNAKDKEFVEL